MRKLKKNVDCNSKANIFEIVFIGDIHVGHRNAELKIFRNVLNYIQNHESVFWIGMGDYADAIVPQDERRFDFDAVDRRLLTPEEQYNFIYESFKPIADRCLGLLTGNHDDVLREKYYHDWVDELAFRLGVFYGGIASYIRLNFNCSKSCRTLNFYLHHGYYTGRTKSGQINRLESMMASFEADVYAMGHVHELAFTTSQTLYYNRSMKEKEKLKYGILTGGFLRGYVEDSISYIEKRMLRPTRLGSAKITVKPFQKGGIRVEPGEVY
jgi:predicted phosphodiesterase